jgi:hypothetical protein
MSRCSAGHGVRTTFLLLDAAHSATVDQAGNLGTALKGKPSQDLRSLMQPQNPAITNDCHELLLKANIILKTLAFSLLFSCFSLAFGICAISLFKSLSTNY